MVKKFIEIIPLLTGVLIFLGYWNLHSYYIHFGLDVFPYINTGELILSFLPVVITIIIVLIIVFSLFFLTSLYEPSDPDKLIGINLRRLFNKNEYVSKRFPRLISSFMGNLLGFLISILPLICILYICYSYVSIVFSDSSSIYKQYYKIALGIIIFIVVIIPYLRIVIIKGFEKINRSRLLDFYSKFHWYIEAIAIFFIFNTLGNYKEAYRIIDNNPIKEIKFNIDTISYSTNDSLFYIGQTQNYLFLRNSHNAEILVFEVNKISGLITKKID